MNVTYRETKKVYQYPLRGSGGAMIDPDDRAMNRADAYAAATGTAITLNGAPTLVTMQADSAFMTAINTLKSRNWTPTYKGTAL